MRLLSGFSFPKVYLLWGASVGFLSAPGFGQETEETSHSSTTPALIQTADAGFAGPTSGVTAEAWGEIIQAAVIAAVPATSVNDKHWGQTTEVLSRYEIKTRKGRLWMRPRTKTVNHGLWQRHTLILLDPEKTLRIEFRNVKRPAEGPMTFTMQLVLRARTRAEFENWLYGVKGLNGKAEADVTFTAAVQCAIDLTTDRKSGDLLPSLQLVPEVQDLRLKVHDIDARQIGLIGGWAAEELGDSSRSIVNSILHQYEGAILKDLRRKIEKNRDRLRITPGELLTHATLPGPSKGTSSPTGDLKLAPAQSE